MSRPPLLDDISPAVLKALFGFSLCPTRFSGPDSIPEASSFRAARLYDSGTGAYTNIMIRSMTEPSKAQLTSGKSTQNAFIFSPYKKLAKFSLNLDKLSCISCRCMKFASKSAIESESSASPGSSASNGNSDELPPAENPWLSLRDVREPERSGVVGLDGGLLRDIEADLFAPLFSMLKISDGCTEYV